MLISTHQADALSEIIHIGYGRAAAALSAMTHERVILQAPQLSVLPITELHAHFKNQLGTQVACVNQGFSGAIDGHSMLLLERSAAMLLSNVLDVSANHAAWNGHSRDIITEVGNVLLNACLGVFGSLLHIQLGFSVPSLHVGETLSILATMVRDDGPLNHAVVVETRFTLKDTDITGVMVILLGVSSLAQVLHELDSLGA